jgi:pentose-5-phosphate-3-epimerase
MSIVVPAVLPSSREELKEKLALFARIPSVKRIQIDVVDGRFVGPASWPYNAPTELEEMVKRGEMLPRLDCLEYEIDLMCLDADEAAASWLALGATRLTFHAETATDLPRFLASARERYGGGDGFASGLISFGLAINIASDLALIEPCLGEVEYVQFMGIARIGRQGQPFDRRVLEKVRMFHSRHPLMPLQVDGGLSLPSARQLVALGVTNLVVGSGILKAKNPAAALAALEEIQGPYGV